jgi:hypothetical protein
MKMPSLVICLTAISFFALSAASRAAPPGCGVSTVAVEVSTAGDFMAASPVAVLAGHSVREGTQ